MRIAIIDDLHFMNAMPALNEARQGYFADISEKFMHLMVQ